MSTIKTPKSKEEIQKQCKTFLDRNSFKMAVVPIRSDYGDMEVESYEVYLIPKGSSYLSFADIKKNGIFVHRE